MELNSNGPQTKKFWVEQGYDERPTLVDVEQFFADARDQPVPGDAAFSLDHMVFEWGTYLWSSDKERKGEAKRGKKAKADYRKGHPHEWVLKLAWELEVDVTP